MAARLLQPILPQRATKSMKAGEKHGPLSRAVQLPLCRHVKLVPNPITRCSAFSLGSSTPGRNLLGGRPDLDKRVQPVKLFGFRHVPGILSKCHDIATTSLDCNDIVITIGWYRKAPCGCNRVGPNPHGVPARSLERDIVGGPRRAQRRALAVNTLKPHKQAQIVSLLVEGASIRSIRAGDGPPHADHHPAAASRRRPL